MNIGNIFDLCKVIEAAIPIALSIPKEEVFKIEKNKLIRRVESLLEFVKSFEKEEQL